MAELHLWDNSYLGPWIFGSVNDVVLLQSFQQQKTRPSKYKNKTTRWLHQQVGSEADFHWNTKASRDTKDY